MKNSKVTSLSKIKPSPNNPRVIRDERFKKLVKSLKDFPEMIEVRPLIVNKNKEVLGGNMRLRAMVEAGWKEAPVVVVDWDEDKQREFMIKDNLGYGEWDWDALANEWDSPELSDWGLDVWQAPEDVDYSILDTEDLSDEVADMADGVRKAIQIEFEREDYEEAYKLLQDLRQKAVPIGKVIINALRKTQSEMD